MIPFRVLDESFQIFWTNLTSKKLKSNDYLAMKISYVAVLTLLPESDRQTDI